MYEHKQIKSDDELINSILNFKKIKFIMHVCAKKTSFALDLILMSAFDSSVGDHSIAGDKTVS